MLSLQGDARQPQPLHKLQSLPQLQQLFGVSVPGGSGFHALGASDAETPFALQLLDSSADIKTLITKPIEGDEDIHLNLSHENYKAGNYNKALEYSNDVYIKNPKRTDNLLLLGAIYYQLQDFDACIAKNQEALAIDPHFPECYGNMANAWKEKGDINLAIQLYQTALKLRPNFADAWSNLASAYTRIGRLNDAAQCCRHALALNPRLVDAHSNLGNLMKAQGLYQEAYNCYLEALRVQPTFAIAWSNLAGLLMEVGDPDRALLYYKEAVKLKPKFADAYLNLGNVYKSLRMPQDAILCYQHAIQERPTYAMAYGNLAGIYYEQGQLDLAILHYKQAINCDSTFVEAYNNLGNALKDTGHVEEAINCYRSCLAFQPSHPQALTNLGNIYMECNCMGIAASFYKATLSVTTGLSAPFSNLAMIYKQQGNYAETIACYNEVLRIDPSAADGLVNRGNTFKEIGRVSEAIQDYIRAVNIRPTMPEAHANLASAYKDSGLAEAAIKSYRQALMLRPDFPEATCNLLHTLQCVCDWDDREKRFSEVESILRRQIKMSVLPSVQPFHAIAYPIDKMLALEISRRYAAHCSIIASRYGLPAFAHPLRVPVKADSKSGRLRVGYMSSDFGNHPLSHLMGSVFGMHNQENIEVFCYALSQNDGSEWRQRIQSEAEHFIDVSSMSSDLIARKINEDGINILVNLNGYTKGARNEIFAMQPAPIQVSYMGFPGTTGASYIDYLVTDEFVSPTRLSHIYSEKLVHLPHCYFVNDYKQKNRDVLVPISRHKRADYGLPEDKFVFACFNQLYKMDPDIFNTWCNILNRVPSSALWLLRFPAAGETRLRAYAAAQGVKPDQIIFTDVAAKNEHIRRSALADLFLDTPLCNGHTTGTDVLWAGLPMVTLSLDKMATRVAGSLCLATGVGEEMIVYSLKEYEERAVGLAENPVRLQALSSRLKAARMTCPLFDTKRWVRNLERAYFKMWNLYCVGNHPQPFKVTENDDEFPFDR
ncbi:probable UDP-N-acetylglucosamine--peptide N-acetylglucosaminyltransferase SEC [Zingiber officinale]|uniref:probable UDP-N-acetylglucosamine--peptide N-acetylglucosaminyltransferase SEC n=1 Tax=Zingiber officinale TaxID=94328 RepID=UPI001C4B3768|nr:probable UDP-N-acetylglucosamine--peptide N-acetylglucosaminyltransferase SEC [Zingiber officinale]